MQNNILQTIITQNYSFDEIRDLSLYRKGIDNDIYVFYSREVIKQIARVGKRDIGEGIKFELELIKILNKQSVSVPVIISTINGDDLVKLSKGQIIICFEFIDGEPVKYGQNYKPNLNLVRQAGGALGAFHRATVNLLLEVSMRRTVFSELERVLQLKDKILEIFEDGKDFICDVEQSLEWVKKVKTTWGIIHSDYNPSNILFKNLKCKAIVDFDWACRGPLLMDLGHGTACWSSAEKQIEPYWDAFNVFVKGYSEKSQIKVKMDDEFFKWTAYSCLYMAANMICDTTIVNHYQINKVEQSWMYKRFKFYRDFLNT